VSKYFTFGAGTGSKITQSMMMMMMMMKGHIDIRNFENYFNAYTNLCWWY